MLYLQLPGQSQDNELMKVKHNIDAANHKNILWRLPCVTINSLMQNYSQFFICETLEELYFTL